MRTGPVAKVEIRLRASTIGAASREPSRLVTVLDTTPPEPSRNRRRLRNRHRPSRNDDDRAARRTVHHAPELPSDRSPLGAAPAVVLLRRPEELVRVRRAGHPAPAPGIRISTAWTSTSTHPQDRMHPRTPHQVGPGERRRLRPANLTALLTYMACHIRGMKWGTAERARALRACQDADQTVPESRKGTPTPGTRLG